MKGFQPGAVPEIISLIPSVARLRPYAFPDGTAERLLGLGYVEEEYIVAGRANLYCPARPDADPYDRYAGELFGAVEKPDLPYRTRVLIRRPTDSSRFNGTVHIEPLHNMHELAPDWNIAQDWIIRTGAAWVGITSSAGSRLGLGGRPTGGVAFLRSLDRQRYGSLELQESAVALWPFIVDHGDELLKQQFADRLTSIDWTRPLSDLSLTLSTQEMLRTFAHSVDVVKQVGTLLKSDHGDRPLSIPPVRRAYISGASGTGVYLHTFLFCGHHDALPDGRPIFDAYVPMVTFPPAKIRIPDSAIVVSVVGEHEVLGIAGQGLELPPDSDSPRFRYYEIPGTGHRMRGPNPMKVTGTDGPQQDNRFGTSGSDASPPHDPHYDKPDYPIFHAIWQNIDRWLDSGVPMPSAPRIVRDTTAPDGIGRDLFGNAKGGLRPPWIEYPDAQYGDCPEHPFESCMRPLTLTELEQRGLDSKSYDLLATAYIETMIAQRFLLREDAPVYLAALSL